MNKLFRPLDRRIASDLKRQRKTIISGLICVAIGSLLTAATLALTLEAMTAIGKAAPVSIDVRELQNNVEAEKLAEQLELPATRVAEALQKASAVDEIPDEIAKRQDDALKHLLLVCIGVVAVFALKYGFTRGQVYFLTKASSRLASDLREKLFAKLMRLPVSYFNSKRTGELQSIISNDVGVYQNAVTIIRDSIDGPIKAIVALGFVFYIQWQLGLLAILFVPVLAFVVNRTGKKIKKAQSSIQEDLAAVTALSQEALSGTRVIKSFSAELRMQDVFNKSVERQYESQLLGARIQASMRPMVELFGATAIALIMYVCGWLAKWDLLTIAEIIMVVQALDMVNQGAKSMSYVTSTYNQVQAATDRIYGQILDVPDEDSDPPHAKTLSNPVGRIAFENVSFQYPDGTPALNNVSFVLEPGESLALVGPSGAGKSTIADLVLRFYDPTDGRITFDGTDYRDLRIAWLREQFGVVPQQTFLFAGTIEANLKLGRPEATPELLDFACQQANAKTFIDAIPEGMQTQLGERGVRLSGGELQRLAIARALVAEPKVLILDEATSNLDAVSERLVTDALEKVMSERTTLFIAHRLSTAARATKILVLRKGEVLESGSHDELMKAKGAYAGMYQAFSSGVLDDAVLT
ncbi:ABC transporter ATP-binding protein [Kamptonema cortianum]|nr:ABC transporter ATP-binding protein [Geitlerinema splendidum]MDK3162271.1 ABC transporter ATP-binding protein [Kamptonema cortianum]